MNKKLNIPSDWNSDFLGNLASISTGSKNTQDKIDDGKYPFFVRSQTIERINSFSFDGEAVLTAGDGVGTGKVFHYINGKFDFHQRVYKISNFKNQLFSGYFFEYFRQNFIRQVVRYTAKTSVDSVRMEMLTRMEIPLPPFEEQKKIAQILSTWNGAIEAVEELIENKERLKNTLLHTLVIGKKKIVEFKNSKWIIKTLSELGGIASGGTPDTTQNEYWDGQIAWCTPTDITALKGKRQISQTSRTITEKGMRKSSANLLPENSIIVCTRATIGDVAMNTIPMATNQGFKSLVPNKGNDNNYLYYLVLTLKKTFIRLSSGSTFLELSKKDFAKTTVTIPERIEEQKKIAEIMMDVDGEIELLKIKRSMLVRQKKGLMQRLLTGKVRLN